MKTYNLRALNNLAKTNNFNRDRLEKVLRLSELLELFNSHRTLKGMYVLKGGTAINLCLFDFPRLSIDIDMNFHLDCSKNKMIEIRKRHKKIIIEEVTMKGYTVDPKSRFTFSLDSYILKYTNAIGRPDNIKLELNYSNRISLLEPVYYSINSSIIGNTTILGLDKSELYGTKIAALINRTTARDIYDVYEMIMHNIIDKDAVSYLRKCSIFYMMTSNEFDSLDTLLNQFQSNMEKMTFYKIKRNLIPLLPVGSQIDVESFKKIVLDYIDALFQLDEKEHVFINQFIKGKYLPRYLFDEKTASRIMNHPMALWKIKHFNSPQK